MAEATSKRPYLIRAMHEWMTDNNLTPHIVVAADTEGLAVPAQYHSDGKVILNVGYNATRGLTLGDEFLSFETRFGGVSQHLDVPTAGVIGIYAQETGQGMIFTDEDPVPPGSGSREPNGATSARPTLKVVK